MPPRNPSEYARLEVELAELKTELQGYYPKAHKASLIRQVREIERILGIESKPYNSEEF